MNGKTINICTSFNKWKAVFCATFKVKIIWNFWVLDITPIVGENIQACSWKKQGIRTLTLLSTPEHQCVA